jgi:hypothetical protein
MCVNSCFIHYTVHQDRKNRSRCCTGRCYTKSARRQPHRESSASPTAGITPSTPPPSAASPAMASGSGSPRTTRPVSDRCSNKLAQRPIPKPQPGEGERHRLRPVHRREAPRRPREHVGARPDPERSEGAGQRSVEVVRGPLAHDHGRRDDCGDAVVCGAACRRDD